MVELQILSIDLVTVVDIVAVVIMVLGDVIFFLYLLMSAARACFSASFVVMCMWAGMGLLSCVLGVVTCHNTSYLGRAQSVSRKAVPDVAPPNNRGGGEKLLRGNFVNGRPPLLGLKEGDVSLSASTIHNISLRGLISR